jgi:hypothetical protein
MSSRQFEENLGANVFPGHCTSCEICRENLKLRLPPTPLPQPTVTRMKDRVEEEK